MVCHPFDLFLPLFSSCPRFTISLPSSFLVFHLDCSCRSTLFVTQTTPFPPTNLQSRFACTRTTSYLGTAFEDLEDCKTKSRERRNEAGAGEGREKGRGKRKREKTKTTQLPFHAFRSSSPRLPTDFILARLLIDLTATVYILSQKKRFRKEKLPHAVGKQERNRMPSLYNMDHTVRRDEKEKKRQNPSKEAWQETGKDNKVWESTLGVGGGMGGETSCFSRSPHPHTFTSSQNKQQSLLLTREAPASWAWCQCRCGCGRTECSCPSRWRRRSARPTGTYARSCTWP